MTKSRLYLFLKDSYYHWSDHRASRMGAALSYYTIFSIIPLLSIIVLIAGASLGHAYIETQLVKQISSAIGPASAQFIDAILEASIAGAGGIIVSVISFVVLIVGTLSMLRELRSSMDDLWDAPDDLKNTPWIKSYIVTRLISLSLIPVLVFLLIASMVFSALLSLAGPNATLFLKLGTSVFSLVAASALFAFIFRFLPTRKLPWKEIAWGAFGTALLFLAGKYAIGLYLDTFAGTSVFGAAGAFVVILLWIYYSVQIFYFGASMTYVWSKKHGHLRSTLK